MSNKIVTFPSTAVTPPLNVAPLESPSPPSFLHEFRKLEEWIEELQHQTSTPIGFTHDTTTVIERLKLLMNNPSKIPSNPSSEFSSLVSDYDKLQSKGPNLSGSNLSGSNLSGSNLSSEYSSIFSKLNKLQSQESNLAKETSVFGSQSKMIADSISKMDRANTFSRFQDLDCRSSNYNLDSAGFAGSVDPLDDQCGTLIELIDKLDKKKGSPSIEELDTSSSDLGPPNLKSAPKKKRKRRKKKRTASRSPLSPKFVRFDTVSVREYRRCLGLNTVPLEGGWPLGISDTCVREFQLGLEDFEARRQMDLKVRLSQRKSSGNIINGIEDEEQESHNVLETRQFDFKTRGKHSSNPKSSKEEVNGVNILFGPLLEEERKIILQLDMDKQNTNTNGNKNSPEHKINKTNHRNRRSRRNSPIDNIDLPHPNTSSSHQNNKIIEHDLDTIRNQRKTIGTGCSCHKMTTLLKPPPYTNHKTANHHNHHHHTKRRLPLRRLKEELRKRNLHSQTDDRDLMEEVLYNATIVEPCCRADNCPCVKNGIGCQADSCSCWHPPQNNQEHRNNNNAIYMGKSIQEIEEECGSQYGIYAVDFKGIRGHQEAVLMGGGVDANMCMPAKN